MSELNMKQKRILFEAYRRNEMTDSFERSKPITKRWLGLGTLSAYRPALDAGLMVFHDGRNPPSRCMGWLTLTRKGLKAMREHDQEFKAILDQMKKAGYEKTYHANYMLMGGLTA